jgi:hypothetical protein
MLTDHLENSSDPKIKAFHINKSKVRATGMMEYSMVIELGRDADDKNVEQVRRIVDGKSASHWKYFTQRIAGAFLI